MRLYYYLGLNHFKSVKIYLIQRKMIPYIGLGIGLYSIVFLLLFQPFGEIIHNGDVLIMLAIMGFGVVSALVYILLEYLVRPLFFLLMDRSISVNVLGWYFFLLSVIGLSIYFYKLTLGSPPSINEFYKTVYRTFILAAVPLFILWLISFVKKKIVESVRIKLSSENGRTQIFLDQNELLYIKSEDNYSLLVMVKNGFQKKILLRGSLRYFEKQLENYSIIRCHRSFLINLNKIDKFTFNSKGGTVYLEESNESIPVSKKHLKMIPQEA